MLTIPNNSAVFLVDEATFNAAQELFDALLDLVPQTNQARIKATEGYAMASDVLEGSEA